jgi:3-methyl-2-oxobutanoate hydroxymethyltransferase
MAFGKKDKRKSMRKTVDATGEKITVEDIRRRKHKQKITMLTCYDYSFARILDAAGVDILLVGDSLANVVLGLKETRKVRFRQMCEYTQAVSRGVRRALLVADMPYLAYQRVPQRAHLQARKLIRAGADAVKVEWFRECPQVIRRIRGEGIAVMGHIGLTPQTAHLLGGYKVQGRDKEGARRLISQAEVLQRLGVFSLVLECIPYELARQIQKRLSVPTIGIGAGKYCDGQVLVLYDMLGLYPAKARFVRRYADFSSQMGKAVSHFRRDVEGGNFPSFQESFSWKQKR